MKIITLKSLAIMTLISVASLTSYAQETGINTDTSLKGQYQLLISKSKNFDGYYLISPPKLSALWKNLSDSLKSERNQLHLASAKLKENEASIASLKNEISTKENSLNAASSKVDEIKFIGISFNKSTYSKMVWTFIFALGAALAYILFKSNRYRKEANYRIQLYQEITDEFQSYKAKAIDKEKKLARELQDERNKIEDYRFR